MPTEKNVFRKLDSDSSPLALPAGAALDMLNVRVTETGCYNVKGTVVRFNDGAGTAFNLYKCVGAYEDKQGDSVIFFMATVNQSLNNTINRIYRYFPATRTHTLIFDWKGLGLIELKDIALVENLLFWTDGIGEIKQINITRKTLYDKLVAAPDGITYVDTNFTTLVKRPPGMPLKATTGIGSIPSTENGYQFTYRYVFVDNERSVFAPFTPLFFYSKLQLDLFAFNEQIPGNAIAVEYGYRKNNGGDVFIFRKQPLSSPPKTTDVSQLFWFEDKMVAEIVPAEEAMRLFDAIPLKADTLTIARNRLFIGSYTEDYDYFNTLTMAIAQTAVAASTVAAGTRVHKAASQKQLGLVPVDYAGRTFGVITKPEWVVTTADFMNAGYTGVVTKLTATINGAYPSWVKYFEIVTTQDLSTSYFLQGFGYLVHYFGDFEGVPQFGQIYGTAFGSTPPKETYIEIAGLTARGVGYTYEEGDYVNVRYRKRSDDSIVAANGIKIRGQRGSMIQIDPTPELNDYHILNGDGTYNAYDGLIFEIYRPYRQTENEPFYSTGIRFRANTNGAPLVNKIVDIPGDVYQLPNTQYNDGRYAEYKEESGTVRNYPIVGVSSAYFPYIQAMSPFDKQYATWFRDYSKAYLHLPDAKQRYKKNYERFSNKYLSGTKINGLNTFEALNEKDLPIENGGIKKLILASNAQAEGTVLLAIMQNETESQYLGEAQFRDTQGNTTLAISNQVIGSTNTLRGGYGTVNPESVAADDNGNVYWWDATKGEPVRYGADGLAPLASICNMRGFFREVSKAQLELGRQPINNVAALSPKVYGGYDPVNQEYVMHFKAVIDANATDDSLAFGGFSIAYSNRLKAFTSRYDFQPERFVKSNTFLFSFAKGQMWEHEASETANNFFGDQFTSSIRFISNQEPHLVKVWKSVAIEGQTIWVPKELSNEMNQASEMKAAWFRNQEGMFYGAIRRNNKGKVGDDAIRALNNGNELRSTYLDILLENDSTELTRLDAVNVMYVASSGHTTIN